MSSMHAQDSASFEEIVVPLMADAYRTARRFARQHDEARDLTQEALLRALRGFRHFTPGTNARAWLRTIVHSVFLTRHRRRQREPQVVGHEIEDVCEDAPVETPVGITDPRLHHAFNQLPQAFRDAVRLVDLDELTYEEAARALRCNVNTLKSRVHRGRRRLVAMLRDHYSPGCAEPRW